MNHSLRSLRLCERGPLFCLARTPGAPRDLDSIRGGYVLPARHRSVERHGNAGAPGLRGVAAFEGLYCAPSGLLQKGVTLPQGAALGFVMAALSGRPQGDG
jgi:hypothetical protein